MLKSKAAVSPRRAGETYSSARHVYDCAGYGRRGAVSTPIGTYVRLINEQFFRQSPRVRPIHIGWQRPPLPLNDDVEYDRTFQFSESPDRGATVAVAARAVAAEHCRELVVLVELVVSVAVVARFELVCIRRSDSRKNIPGKHNAWDYI